MAEGLFVEGDQASKDKDPDEGQHERVPSRLVEEHGDDVLHQLPEPGTPLRQNDVALDEGTMVSELLKKSRLKNPTLTDRKSLLLEDKNLSVLLEATQNITLRYHVLGTIQEPASETPITVVKGVPATAAALPTSGPRALSSSDEMLYFKEKVRSAPGPVLERKGASCSRLQHMGGIKARIGGGAVPGKATPTPPVVRCATLPPAYSPSQLNMNHVKSQIAGLTLKKSSLLRAGDGEQAARKLSKITQIVIGAAAKPQQPSHAQLQKPKQRPPSPPAPPLELDDACEECYQLVPDDTEGVRDMPLLEVLDKCELERVSAAELVRRRVRRYYTRELGVVTAAGRSCSGISDAGEVSSLVKLDLTMLPTETSELATERIATSRAGGSPSPHESSTSWYSFESDPSSRSSAVLQAASASYSEAGSWVSRRGSTPAAAESGVECFKASSLIRYFESIRPQDSTVGSP
ncbi:uncharacterized protein LOC142817418 [Rhipicephalus microplus]|uniref:uncharacterized protein LOC142817418 n=1 Tax=Rhipicephalus microplus TaxID=6941 RepID=UPI003F6D3BA3